MQVQIKTLKIKPEVRADHLVAAIKAVREVTGWGLKQALDFTRDGVIAQPEGERYIKVSDSIRDLFDFGEPKGARLKDLLKEAGIVAVETEEFSTAIEILQLLKNL